MSIMKKGVEPYVSVFRLSIICLHTVINKMQIEKHKEIALNCSHVTQLSS